jgi:hypothetical protein
MALQPDGKLVVAGFSSASPTLDPEPCLAQLDAFVTAV